MKIEWLGHACFCITAQRGLKIITDPYEPGFRGIISYDPIDRSADIVTVSHDHGDHNWVAAISGNPAIVNGAGMKSAKGVDFKGIATYHDQAKGAERGPNTIFTFEIDGIRLAHLGDLGHPLNIAQLNELKGTQVLFAPVGGPSATIELQDVIDLWEKLKPAVVVPMHFKSPKCSFPKYTIEDLLRLKPQAKKLKSTELILTQDTLPATTQIMILQSQR